MAYPVYYDGQIEIQPRLTETHARLVQDVVNMKDTDETRPVFAAIKGSEEPDLPGYGGQFCVSEDGANLYPEDGESRHGLRLWLALLLEHFFIPQGYILNGEISWDASDDAEDRGTVYVHNNKLEATDIVFFDAGPSWSPNHYVDEVLKEAIQQLVDSSNATGCDPDLTVVESEALSKVREMISKAP